jgi:hypothetical protein
LWFLKSRRLPPKNILVHGSIDVTGRFQNLIIVRPLANAAPDSLLSSLAAWQFRLATKDGVPVVAKRFSRSRSTLDKTHGTALKIFSAAFHDYQTARR